MGGRICFTTGDMVWTSPVVGGAWFYEHTLAHYRCSFHTDAKLGNSQGNEGPNEVTATLMRSDCKGWPVVVVRGNWYAVAGQDWLTPFSDHTSDLSCADHVTVVFLLQQLPPQK